MPIDRHSKYDAMRPGDYRFPVDIHFRNALRIPVTMWAIPSIRFQAFAVATLIFLYVSVGTLGGGASTIFATVAILVFGLPHGTLDLEIIKRERSTSRLGISALLLLYLGMAGGMAAVWQFAPVMALAAFLVVAVVHFAEDWPELKSAFLAQGMSIALLTAPALFHLAELEVLFAAVTGRSDAAFLANFMLLLAPTSMAVACVSAWTLWRTGNRDQSCVAALSLAGMIALPPVIGFACFFCLSHSPRHLGTALAQLNFSARSRWVVPLVTLAALGIAALLFNGAVHADLPARFVSACFMTLSLLTVPHMAMPLIVEALAVRRSRIGRQRTSARA